MDVAETRIGVVAVPVVDSDEDGAAGQVSGLIGITLGESTEERDFAVGGCHRSDFWDVDLPVLMFCMVAVDVLTSTRPCVSSVCRGSGV